MFPSIYTIIKKVIFYKLLHDYIKVNYPEQYNYVFINLGYYSLYVFTKFQIIFNKTNKQITSVINNSPFLTTLIQKINITKNPFDLEFIKNGEIIDSCYVSSFYKSNMKINEETFEKCDFAVFSDYENSNDNCVNKKIINSTSNIDLNCKTSNIKFILFEVSINGKDYKIDLKNENYNYYVIDNIIDFNFIIYYLNYFYLLSLSNDEICSKSKNGDYKIKIIDNNANIVEINKISVSIQIKENNYILIDHDESAKN